MIVILLAGGILLPTAAASPPTGHGAQLSAKVGAALALLSDARTANNALDDLLTVESRQENAINTHVAGNDLAVLEQIDSASPQIRVWSVRMHFETAEPALSAIPKLVQNGQTAAAAAKLRAARTALNAATATSSSFLANLATMQSLVPQLQASSDPLVSQTAGKMLQELAPVPAQAAAMQKATRKVAAAVDALELR